MSTHTVRVEETQSNSQMSPSVIISMSQEQLVTLKASKIDE